MTNPLHPSVQLLKNYHGWENNLFYPTLKFETIQMLGQFKNRFCKKSRLAKFLNLGSGNDQLNEDKDFINIDCHTKKTLFCFQDPVFRWDLRRGIPFPDESVEGIFTEHFLEHLNPMQSFTVLEEAHRVLIRGGVLRVVVPDAKKYVEYYNRKNRGEATDDMEGFNGWRLGAEALRGLTCYLGHYNMFDIELLSELCRAIGFSGSEEKKFRVGKIKELLIDHPDRVWNSLYFEAYKS